jgi:membrane protease YdiL (CAAX protease family)
VYLLRWEPQIEAMQRFLALGRKYPASLAIETTAVSIGTVAAIRFLNVQPAVDFKWLIIPCLLVSASLLPTWLRKGEFPPMCPTGRHIVTSLAMACGACLCTIPAVILGLWLMVRMHWPIPLRPVVAGPDGWFPWLVYQFLYVAVAEELFFRGYLQANVMRLLGDARPGSRRIDPYVAIVISAGCFALAHAVVQGQITSLLTFLPGLILAWLFIRTHSLLAPILFHGLANVSYGVIALNLT